MLIHLEQIYSKLKSGSLIDSTELVPRYNKLFELVPIYYITIAVILYTYDILLGITINYNYLVNIIVSKTNGITMSTKFAYRIYLIDG